MGATCAAARAGPRGGRGGGRRCNDRGGRQRAQPPPSRGPDSGEPLGTVCAPRPSHTRLRGSGDRWNLGVYVLGRGPRPSSASQCSRGRQALTKPPPPPAAASRELARGRRAERGQTHGHRGLAGHGGRGGVETAGTGDHLGRNPVTPTSSPSVAGGPAAQLPAPEGGGRGTPPGAVSPRLGCRVTEREGGGRSCAGRG